MSTTRELKELGEKRSIALDKAKAIYDAAKKENRSMTAEERENWQKYMDEEKDLAGQSGMLGEMESRSSELRQPANQPDVGRPDSEKPKRVDSEFPVFGPKESIADAYLGEKREDLNVGRVIRAYATNEKRHFEEAEAEFRALGTMPGGAGGFTIPETMSLSIIDKVRNKSVINRAGAPTTPMATPEVSIPEFLTDPTCEWLGEHQQFTPSDPTFGLNYLRARKLGCYVILSVELLQDSSLAAAAVENAIAQSLALNLDSALLHGNGSALKPLGITEWANVQTEAIGGALVMDKISEAVEAIRVVNGEPNAAVMTPQIAGHIDRLKNGDGTYLVPNIVPESIRGITRIASNQVNSGYLVVGDFTQVLVGMRTEMRIEMDKSIYFDKMQVAIRAYLRCDMHLIRQNHFYVMSGITTS